MLLAAKKTVEDCLREGYSPPELQTRGRGAHTEAAQRLADVYGVKPRTAWSWIIKARESDNPDHNPEYSLYRPFQYQVPGLHRGGDRSPFVPEGNRTRIALIGDAHDSPHLVKDRFYWMGRWAASEKFDEVRQLGDFATLDSLTRHAAPGTKEFSGLPSFKDDLDSLDEALREFNRGLGKKKIRKVFQEGNHEYRAYRYEDLNPQMSGLVVSAIHALFQKHGWEIVPFNQYAFVQGVGFIHHPISGAGKPFGGETGNQRAGNKALFSIVHGHDHRRELVSSSKIGPHGAVDVMSLPCALPHGFYEDYAKHGPNGWAWGVTDMTVCQGQILECAFISMLRLEEKFSV